MRGHEGYEEGKLYPYLQARYGVNLSPLEEQHQELKVAEDRVHAAHEAADALAAAHAYKKHDEILVPHLRQEEDIVIPLLLSMKRSEFERYANGSISTLLRLLAEERAAQNDEA